MKKMNLNPHNRSYYVFRQWSNKSYAVFSSLKKVIKISTLFFAYSILIMPERAFAQADTSKTKEIQLDELIISAERSPVVYSQLSRSVTVIDKEEIATAPVSSIDDILEYAMSIDVRQRGNGIQADVSIRGGTFDQALILLNGVKLNDPQTGHYNLDIPISIGDIDRIEILEGPGSRVFGPNAFSGAINIITGSKKTDNFNGAFTFGEHGFFENVFSGIKQTGFLKNYLTFSRTNSDGYIHNTDYSISNIYYQGTMDIKTAKLEVQTGYQHKMFGANSFYTAAYPDQFERTRTFFINTRASFGDKFKFTPGVYWRRHFDRFELFRESYYQKNDDGLYIHGNDTAGYNTSGGFFPYTGHNYHMTDVLGGELNVSHLSKIGKSSIGIEYRLERILSNKLGDLTGDTLSVPGEQDGIFTREKQRENISLFLEHIFYIRKFSLSTGILANYNSNFDWKIYWGMDASYAISNEIKVMGSVNQSLRLPTFTDLYYVGPTNTGNPNLKPEKATNYEIGTRYQGKYFSSQATVFYRKGEDMIDWVKQADSLKWESKNITTVDTRGFEISGKINTGEIKFFKNILRSIQFSYSYIDIGKHSGDYISAYILDYLKDKFTIGIQHNIVKNVILDWKYTYQDRTGTYTNISGTEVDYDPFSRVDARLSYQSKPFYLYVEATNLLNETYRDFGYVQLPGMWVKAGLKLNLDF